MKKHWVAAALAVLLLAACSPAEPSGGGPNIPDSSSPAGVEGPAASTSPAVSPSPSTPESVPSEETQSQPPAETESPPPAEVLPGYELHTFTLPSSDAEKTRHNAFIYEHSCSVSLCLPEGWSIEEAAARKEAGLEVMEAVDGIFSIQCILDENQVPVGTIGYNEAPTIGTENRGPMALFAFITLSNHSFICSESPPYSALWDDGNFLVATTQVQYRHPLMDGLPTTYNWGILARDEQLEVYVAIELDDERIDEEQLAYIAQTLRLSEAG